MSVYKDEKTGKWYALAWYHDWKGEGRQKCKRGFETKKEAQDWERSYHHIPGSILFVLMR